MRENLTFGDDIEILVDATTLPAKFGEKLTIICIILIILNQTTNWRIIDAIFIGTVAREVNITHVYFVVINHRFLINTCIFF